MRMFTIPNQPSVPMAYKEFDEAGRMRPSAYYDRVIDAMEELFKFILLLRGAPPARPSRGIGGTLRDKKAEQFRIQEMHYHSDSSSGNRAPTSPGLLWFVFSSRFVIIRWRVRVLQPAPNKSKIKGLRKVLRNPFSFTTSPRDDLGGLAKMLLS